MRWASNTDAHGNTPHFLPRISMAIDNRFFSISLPALNLMQANNLFVVPAFFKAIRRYFSPEFVKGPGPFPLSPETR